MKNRRTVQRLIVACAMLAVIAAFCAPAIAGERNMGNLNRDGQPFPATYWSNVASFGTADAGLWHATLLDGSQIWLIRPEHVQMVIWAKLYRLPLFVTWADQYSWTELAINY